MPVNKHIIDQTLYPLPSGNTNTPREWLLENKLQPILNIIFPLWSFSYQFEIRAVRF
jgi:hypothetical protein